MKVLSVLMNSKPHNKFGKLTKTYNLVGYKDGLHCLLSLRIHETENTVYAYLRADKYSASGRAGGGGYCKESAAVDAAFSNLGIKLDREISSVGLIADAMLAYANHCGYREAIVV